MNVSRKRKESLGFFSDILDKTDVRFESVGMLVQLVSKSSATS